ncbi:unnamed protein product [Prorocentrum cordatum]|uniref:Uncharacterized protein n=1 Tax=Prorocentrum cordatum TaxID=2364126 RepID=A0ABN9XYL2_9DINO|nr:unnamed protein product [Polarella glacialis]
MEEQAAWSISTHAGSDVYDQPERSYQILALSLSERRAAEDIIHEIEGMLKHLVGEDSGVKVEDPTDPSKRGIRSFQRRKNKANFCKNVQDPQSKHIIGDEFFKHNSIMKGRDTTACTTLASTTRRRRRLRFGGAYLFAVRWRKVAWFNEDGLWQTTSVGKSVEKDAEK